MLKMDTMTKINIHIDESGNIQQDHHELIQISNQGPLEITVSKGAEVELEVVLATPLAISYVISPNANVKLIEIRRFSHGGSFERKMQLDANSQVKSVLLNENDHEEALEMNEVCHISRDASIEVSYGELSDGDTKATLTYELDEQGASAHLYLAATSRNSDHKSYQVTLNHHAKNTYGLMENYGVTRHQSYLTFDGVGRIDKGMHQSETHQTSRIIVFEPKCVARANPYLYIDDFDVKASHAASVGAMNEEHLYYLQSRGLTKKQSMHLITLGYLLPAIDVIKDEEITKRFEAQLARKVGEE